MYICVLHTDFVFNNNKYLHRLEHRAHYTGITRGYFILCLCTITLYYNIYLHNDARNKNCVIHNITILIYCSAKKSYDVRKK